MTFFDHAIRIYLPAYSYRFPEIPLSIILPSIRPAFETYPLRLSVEPFTLINLSIWVVASSLLELAILPEPIINCSIS
jgi:hypothetical protein